MTPEPRAALLATPPQRLRRLPTWLVNQVAIRSTRMIGDRLDRPGARSDFAVLATLEEFGAMSQVELGHRLGLDRSDVAAVLDRLQDEHLATRTADDSDRRRNVITMTPAGHRVLEDLAERFDRAQEALLAPLDAAQRGQLIALLQRLVDHHAGPAATVLAPDAGVDEHRRDLSR